MRRCVVIRGLWEQPSCGWFVSVTRGSTSPGPDSGDTNQHDNPQNDTKQSHKQSDDFHIFCWVGAHSSTLLPLEKIAGLNR